MLKRTTEEAKQYFAEQGCELLGEYKGCQTKMKYRCKCGVIAEIDWNHFTGGRRCGLCHSTGRKKKYSLEEIQKIFKDRGCEFLDDEFKSIKYNHNYRCKCGVISTISFMGFYHQKQNCYNCGLEKQSGSNHHMWNPDREQIKLNEKFRKKCYKALQSSLKAINKQKIGKTTNMLGYTPKELQSYVVNHPNWDRVKDTSWHLDHIFPIAAFVEHGVNDISIINCLENLQPISEYENLSKHDAYDKQKFLNWLKSK